MGLEFDLELNTGVFIERWHGDVTIADLKNFWTEKLSIQKRTGCWITLCDVRNSRPTFSVEELRSLVRSTFHSLLADPGAVGAVLTKEGMQYGVARQFIAFSEPIQSTELFTDEAQAYAWLEEQVKLRNTPPDGIEKQ
jgi:hypothetical protein